MFICTHIFSVLFILLCRSRFLSGIIFLLSEGLPSFTFLIVHECPGNEYFQLLHVLKSVYLTLNFGRHFCQTQNSRLIVLFFQQFKDFVSLFSGLHSFLLSFKIFIPLYIRTDVFSDCFSLFLTSLLEYNCLTMVCQFLLYNKVNQLYIYIYPHISSLLCLPLTLPIPPLQVVTKHRADLPVLCSCFPLAIYFTFGSVYMSDCF